MTLTLAKYMNADPTLWKFPVLAALSPPFHIQGIRELSEEEQTRSAEYTEVAVDARNRFKLFTILRKNYQEWSDYTRSLFTQEEGFTDDEIAELDRLQLNYLSSAKSLIDQFRQHWVQSHRNTDREKEYNDFIGRLGRNSWAFSFFQDLRNFTQHCGLPTGNYARTVNINSINILIEADVHWLLAHYDRWDKSKLTEVHGPLNLLELMREYNVYLHEHFGAFLAAEFAPSLLDAHNFFASLAKEVIDLQPKAQFKILTTVTKNGNSFNYTLKTPPSNLLGSIGISMTKKES